MKVYKEITISEFEFWSGAKDTAKYLTEEQMDSIESQLEEIYPEGIGETELNDFFWFEEDTIAEWLGYDDFEDLILSNEGSEED